MIKLYRFAYSCYALKVQYLLDQLQLDYEAIDVPFTDRTELVALTGGRVVVPAIAHGEKVVVESRDICEYLLGLTANTLVPPAQAAVIWGYADWCDSTLENILFRIASPGIAARFATDFEKALFIFVKERKFGEGCVAQWEQSQAELVAQARRLLEKTLQAIAVNQFVASHQVSYADITLLAHLAMVEYANPQLVEDIDPALPEYMARVRAA